MKRAIDIVFSSLGLLVLGIPLLILTFQVRRKLGSPAFFRQMRPGLHGQPFRMLKFRSMTDERGTDGQLLPDGDRLPPFGRFLRATSLDELPGLWNVLKGDMSLVGPRPLAMEYLPLYSPHQARRHEIRPGITGWAQVNGRNAISWETKFDYDVWYVDNQSLFLDLKILILTIKKVANRSDVLAEGQEDVKSFEGTN
jgi:lipopolysaccharide/colanic/teichoic acid biosynthesis glycosyltransferase